LKIFLRQVLEPDRGQVLAAIQQAKTGGSLHFECRICQSSHAVRWIAMQGRVYADETGKPRRIAGVVTDITDRKREEDLLRQAQQELQQTAQSLERRVKERTAKLE